jgi:hypothetical protein
MNKEKAAKRDFGGTAKRCELRSCVLIFVFAKEPDLRFAG